jgi:cytochrome c peroxidase
MDLTKLMRDGAVGFAAVALALACGKKEEAAPRPPAAHPAAPSTPPVPTVKVDQSTLAQFAPLPKAPDWKSSPESKAKVDLGRQLFHDKRLSKAQDTSCSTCHGLATFGMDGKDFSPGFGGKTADRNTPSVYDAALEMSQFWDGRAENVEAAVTAVMKDPVLMGAPDDARVTGTLKSMPEYVDAFKRAFPAAEDAVTLPNVAAATGAFLRTLLTPSKWDHFLEGDKTALTNDEKTGFNKFVEVGCVQCHVGPLVGGTMYQILGKVKPWPNLADKGRSRATNSAGDDMMFKVPSLRNVSRTGPYFHDASAKTLPEAVKLMGTHQLGKELTDADAKSIVDWLDTLSADAASLDSTLPELPASTVKTPKPLKK